MQDDLSDTVAPSSPVYLSRTDAADYIRQRYGFPCSEVTLARLAMRGEGPPFKRASGRFALYAPPALDEWAAGRISDASAIA